MGISNLIYLILAFLCGAIPFAVIIAKVFYNTDIRKHGSGNPGATNILRTLGSKAGLVVLLLDVAKGFLPTFLAATFLEIGTLNTKENMAIAGFIAIMGHVFSPFLKFKGGKGVATATGVIFALDPILALGAMVAFILILILTKFVSLGSMISATLFSILLVLRYPNQYVLILFAILLFGLIIWKHRANINRLLAGNESKFVLKKS